MTEKSVLERLREDLAKIADDLYCICCWEEDAQIAAETIADAIRAHDLSIYESATPAPGATAEASDPRTAEALGAHGAADPDIARLIDWRNADPRKLEPHFSKWMNELTAQGLHGKSDIAVVLALQSAALQRQADQLAEVRKALRTLRAWDMLNLKPTDPSYVSDQPWALGVIDAALKEKS